jgi:hypothetical protein
VKQIEKTAKSWSETYKVKSARVAAHDSFLMGWAVAKAQAVQCLKRQFQGCQPGTRVSYHIAADVLRVEMEEYEKKGWPPNRAKERG